jgi:hypothetical protein
LIKAEKLLPFSGQKRWIFLPGIGSPGKVWHDRTLEVVGSTPIGSTNFFNIKIVRLLSVFYYLTAFGVMMIGTTSGTLGCSSRCACNLSLALARSA